MAQDSIQIIPVKFSEESMEAMRKYVNSRITSINVATRVLKETKITKWRRLYKGTPREEVKNFPWPKASNVVVQLIGTHCDTLRARVLGSIYEILPIFTAGLVGDWQEEEKAEEQRKALEEFMNLVAMEPEELDLYRVESQVADETIKFGSAFAKAPWEKHVESIAIGQVEGKTVFQNLLKYEGPRPEKLAFEDFGIDPNASTLESADFKFHRRRLQKWQLEERVYNGLYDKSSIDKILGTPTRSGPIQSQVDDMRSIGIYASGTAESAEWDIYECYFCWWHNGHKYRIIYSYHLETGTCLKAIFNFYPNNVEPILMARLGYTGDSIYGFGFCEMLEHYQEEVSTSHNQRVDANTLANTSILRASKNSGLDSSISIYPNAIIPAEKDEIEVMNMGRPVSGETQSEMLTLQLSRERSGVEPAVSGAGAGGPNKKGSYSSMGTFSLMQSGNRRSNLNTTDLRYFHTRLGRLCGVQYAEFGIGKRAEQFGKDAQYILKALENLKKNRLNFPIRAANASVNREVEKQNDMLLMNVMRQHNMGIAQILQSINAADPVMKDYLLKVAKTSTLLMKNILKNFGHDDVDRYIAEPVLDGFRQQQTGQQQPGATPVQAGMEGTNPALGAVPQLAAAPNNNPAMAVNGMPQGSGH